MSKKTATHPLKEKCSLTLDQDVKEDIRELAQKDSRSFSQYVNMVLQQHLFEKQSKDTRRRNKDKSYTTVKQAAEKKEPWH